MKTILIVEDIELNIDLLTQLLEDEYRLLTARDGEQAVAFVHSSRPDLILMDISLPGMDGYETTHMIRRSFLNLPIIGLSAHAMQGDAEKALAAGLTDYMTKPVDEDLLFRKLSHYLG